MHIPKSTRTLETAKYSFDASRNAWFCGKNPIDEEEVLICLIQCAKSQHIRDAGAWAESELSKMKKEPTITARTWAKKRIIRNRNNRIAGKYLFASWCHTVGIEIIGELKDFMIRNSLLVARFYNEMATVFGHYKKEARIMGEVCKSVFFGIDIRVSTDFEPADTPKIAESSQSPIFKALRRHLELMTKIYTTTST